MLRAIALAADADLDESEFRREIEPLKQDLKAAKRRLAEAEELAGSREDAWETLSAILDETRNLAETWDVAGPEERKILLDYWVLDVWIVVDPIPGLKRANQKTAVVTLAAAPNLVKPLPVGRQLESASVISSRTQGSSSLTSRRRRLEPIEAITSAGQSIPEAILPSAQAACPRTSASGSSSARVRAGTASGEPQFPSATATLRSSPRRFARFTGDPRNRLENSSCVSDIISVSSTPSTPSRGTKAGSAVGVENLWLNGHTSWQMSQP